MLYSLQSLIMFYNRWWEGLLWENYSAQDMVFPAPRKSLWATKLFSLQSFLPKSFTSGAGMLGCITIIHPEIYKGLIFIRASTSGVCQGIWKPQPLFSASLHQSVWVYLLTICLCFDTFLLICLMSECRMTHLWLKVISQMNQRLASTVAMGHPILFSHRINVALKAKIKIRQP